MKPIDGEWLAAELFKHHVHDEDELEPMVYLSDAQNLIATAPTVDAIPVEWLQEIQERMPELAHKMGIDVILFWWRKEREARD